MKQKFTDYSNCISNLANSILEEFDVKERRAAEFKCVGTVSGKRL